MSHNGASSSNHDEGLGPRGPSPSCAQDSSDGRHKARIGLEFSVCSRIETSLCYLTTARYWLIKLELEGIWKEAVVA